MGDKKTEAPLIREKGPGLGGGGGREEMAEGTMAMQMDLSYY